MLFVFLSVSHLCLAQASVSATYTTGDIPTNFGSYDPTCNGPVTTLSVTLPSTEGSYEIVGVDISYDMISDAMGYTDDQRSQIYCQTTSTLESTVALGDVTGAVGTTSYSRTDVGIANGDYNPGDVIDFEMRAWRTWGGGATDCNTFYNKVDNNSWVVTVHYILCPPLDVTLINQSEVNTFGVELSTVYSNCKYVQGVLTIGEISTTDISNIAALESELDSVGTLEIHSNPLLSSINFSNLLALNWLHISDNSMLSTISFANIENLEQIAIINNAALSTFSFANLISLDLLLITDNSALSSFSFPDLTTINGKIFDLFDPVFYLGLNIRDNSSLVSFNFPQLRSAYGNINIATNPMLTSIEFENLERIEYEYIITNNHTLTQVSCPKVLYVQMIYLGGNWLPLSQSNSMLDSINFPMLDTVEVIYAETALISNLSLPNLQYCNSLTIEGPNLSIISLPSMVDSEDLIIKGGRYLDSLNVSSLEALKEISLDAYSSRYGITEKNITIDRFNDLRNLKYADNIEINNFENFNDCCFIAEFHPDVCTDISLENGNECASLRSVKADCIDLDIDSDNYKNSDDNCPNHYNPNQEDIDGDGIGNACDNCPLVLNVNQLDANDNFIGDACENAEPGKVGVNTTSPNSGLEIAASELYLSDTQRGLIMTNANGECFRLYMDIEGKLQSKLITCPN